MAKIYLNIEAESTDDLQMTLKDLLRGEGRGSDPVKSIEPWVPKNVTKQMYGTFREDADNESVTTPGIVTLPKPTEPYSPEPPTPVDEDVILDAHGHPWSADLHASTKTQTKDGLWRMKPGVERPAPAAGYPKTALDPDGNPPSNEVPTASLTPVEQLAAEAQAEATEADDAEMWADAAGEAPAVPAREWTDADLSKLCNQAAKALEPKGGVQSLKDLVAVYSAAGAVPHSRNIPVEDRERFAGEVEALAGITYEG